MASQEVLWKYRTILRHVKLMTAKQGRDKGTNPKAQHQHSTKPPTYLIYLTLNICAGWEMARSGFRENAAERDQSEVDCIYARSRLVFGI
jgi:hypothetical protein